MADLVKVYDADKAYGKSLANRPQEDFASAEDLELVFPTFHVGNRQVKPGRTTL